MNPTDCPETPSAGFPKPSGLAAPPAFLEACRSPIPPSPIPEESASAPHPNPVSASPVASGHPLEHASAVPYEELGKEEACFEFPSLNSLLEALPNAPDPSTFPSLSDLVDSLPAIAETYDPTSDIALLHHLFRNPPTCPYQRATHQLAFVTQLSTSGIQCILDWASDFEGMVQGMFPSGPSEVQVEEVQVKVGGVECRDCGIGWVEALFSPRDVVVGGGRLVGRGWRWYRCIGCKEGWRCEGCGPIPGCCEGERIELDWRVTKYIDVD
ncbi:hypothetical protein BJ508DRAFT_35205 [Ascobolus immersus RN42]|uniref:Uncharacterized protein n=1 Tax=Ascobolus immersus RN42 TaxID=1160509 RepID=A0A3N4HRN1_ASCIM|nr:hypothetical protein BJ508DRAFT_35205 [Ascobolus immersus RN42]